MTVQKRIADILDKDISVVSFDIFDTILFRNVKKPISVFSKMFHRNSKLFPKYLKAKEWELLRHSTEINLKKHKLEKGEISEVTLAEIYDYLPGIIKNRQQIMELEIAEEKVSCFVNEQIYDVIKQLKQSGKTIILVSDMYLSSDMIVAILSENGFDISLIDKIYVSSEYNKQKTKGLFEIVMEDLGVSAKQILHIGDNINADIISPSRLGIKTFHYNLISEAQLNYPQLFAEEMMFGDICDEIYALRLLAADSNPYDKETQKDAHILFEIGAMNFGPIFTYFSEWVLDKAEENNIKLVLPLMREGKFLSELLNNANKYRNGDIKIEPLYVSRKAFYPGIFKFFRKQDILNAISTQGITVAKIFMQLGIEDKIGKFEKYKDIEMSDLRNICEEKDSVFDCLCEYLTSSEILEKIQNKDYDDSRWQFEYFEQMNMTKEKFITLDVGWRGTSQNLIDRILRGNGVDNNGLHLLMNSSEKVLSNESLNDNTEIIGFTGNYGVSNVRNKLHYTLFEIPVMCDEGSVIGYKKTESKKIEPQLAEVTYSQKQLNRIRCCQEGMLEFQKQYLNLKNTDKFELLKEKSEELLHLVENIMKFATCEQATVLGNYVFDQNFGVDSEWNIIDENVLQDFKRYSYCEFVNKNLGRRDEWIFGMTNLKAPLDYLKYNLFYKKELPAYQVICYAERIMKVCDECNSKVVLVGAGNGCKHIIMAFAIAGRLDLITAITDKTRGMCSNKIKGINVMTLDKAPDNAIYAITAMKKQIAFDIENDIKKLKKEVKVITNFDAED